MLWEYQRFANSGVWGRRVPRWRRSQSISVIAVYIAEMVQRVRPVYSFCRPFNGFLKRLFSDDFVPLWPTFVWQENYLAVRLQLITARLGNEAKWSHAALCFRSSRYVSLTAELFFLKAKEEAAGGVVGVVQPMWGHVKCFCCSPSGPGRIHTWLGWRLALKIALYDVASVNMPGFQNGSSLSGQPGRRLKG